MSSRPEVAGYSRKRRSGMGSVARVAPGFSTSVSTTQKWGNLGSLWSRALAALPVTRYVRMTCWPTYARRAETVAFSVGTGGGGAGAGAGGGSGGSGTSCADEAPAIRKKIATEITEDTD